MNKQQIEKVIEAQKKILEARRMLLDVQQDPRLSGWDRTDLTKIMQRLDSALMQVDSEGQSGLTPFLIRKRVNS